MINRMQLTRSSPSIGQGSLRLEQGSLAGYRYRLDIHVCPNPVCQCRHLDLPCFPESAEPCVVKLSAPICVEMDLANCAIVKDGVPVAMERKLALSD